MVMLMKLVALLQLKLSLGKVSSARNPKPKPSRPKPSRVSSLVTEEYTNEVIDKQRQEQQQSGRIGSIKYPATQENICRRTPRYVQLHPSDNKEFDGKCKIL